ncbi:MAG: hypothetical protein K8E24_001055 [Methanobacterium paludis]|uniref:Uncharacterized protein n=1 Tax=Methanobacterium paludis (strain DSM 25820 / JCM 18151 / SWAN1) TaxID=868131 RepID=F6D4J6_METPW|nr:hypothetical protein [Methanobacterium paludis]AEG19236.1 hypothetical protein MSWAN_2228 [Methanobacterium paludis]MCE7697488.1 hypothetical protein [Methanobacterium paludis]
MNKTVIILALLLVLGTVFIAGCTTTTQNNTSGMGQNKSPTTAGYSIGQIVNIESGNSEIVSIASETVQMEDP